MKLIARKNDQEMNAGLLIMKTYLKILTFVSLLDFLGLFRCTKEFDYVVFYLHKKLYILPYNY
jgi:hypothetical protein